MDVQHVFGVLDGCDVEEARQMTMADKGKETYALMATRVAGVHGSSLSGDGKDKDNVVALEEDYVIDRTGPFLSVKFSDRVL
ncbi:hypothetical protein V6N13_024819 [Hibiscus sabdariffa]|uniref:PPM-type phosphatase domain-containing protein n=2 Tax=Hibiscus sabdariffa TaxID=183260 RepID=A0ABR2BUU3_9ROSI